MSERRDYERALVSLERDNFRLLTSALHDQYAAVLKEPRNEHSDFAALWANTRGKLQFLRRSNLPPHPKLSRQAAKQTKKEQY